MAELATIARPYAEALFRVAMSAKSISSSDGTSGTSATSLATWAELVKVLAQVAQHPDVKALVQNPKISATVVADTILAVLKSPVTQEIKNFVHTLANNNRLLLLPEIASQFIVLKNSQEGTADTTISSAFPLTESQVLDLCATLEKKFGRKLNPSVEIDPALIGGVRVVVGDEVLDTSVRAKLQQMQIALTA